MMMKKSVDPRALQSRSLRYCVPLFVMIGVLRSRPSLVGLQRELAQIVRHELAPDLRMVPVMPQ